MIERVMFVRRIRGLESDSSYEMGTKIEVRNLQACKKQEMLQETTKMSSVTELSIHTMLYFRIL
jgi:hypothetical protein